ncbi:MAG: diacylglycerol kinase family lipid kinase [Anaerolineaceae bacterium]|nr:diacylglycerol kinase family lipid kinase [Anaerolineaceae bacterium]
MRYKFIINPNSNKGETLELIPDIQKLLNQYELDYEMELTEFPQHAIELTRIAVKEGFDVVVAGGGDGTCNEVVNGLMLAKKAGEGEAIMAVLPIGRGNDFNFGNGNPSGWEESCKIISEGHTKRIDVGLAKGGDFPEGRYFGNGIGIGFDAVVGFFATEQRITGFLGYLVAAVRTIFAYSPAPTMQIELEDETIEQPSLMVSTMNGARAGGGFMIAPEATTHDGYFDLCIAYGISKLKTFPLLVKFMSGTQVGDPAVQFRKTKKVTIRTKTNNLPVHMDGETFSKACPEVAIELLHQQIELITPKEIG